MVEEFTRTEEEELDAGEGGEITLDSLSVETLAALNSFLKESSQEKEWIVGNNKEDYSISQFWYMEDTSREIVKEIFSHFEGKPQNEDLGYIAILSAPSLLSVAKEMDAKLFEKMMLLEIDERFGVRYPDNFHKYDYREPTELPQELLAKCEVIVLDPPYLNMETIQEYLISARLLASQPDNPKLLVVTAAVLQDKLKDEWSLLPINNIEVKHSSKLGNPLYVYTNYNRRKDG